VTNGSLTNAGVLALLALIPLVALMLTSFVKVSVVLSLLRNAIGATDAPSGLVVMGLSLILTFFVMAPVAVAMVHAGATAAETSPANPGTPPTPTAPGTPTTPTAPGTPTTPVSPGATTPTAPGAPTASANPATSGSPTTTTGAQDDDLLTALRVFVPADKQHEVDAVERALVPLKGFLAKNAAPRDVQTFVDLGAKLGKTRTAGEMAVLAPAFVTTELREAFAIAVLIFLPFLVIDLLVGLGMSSLGLSTMSPQVVSLPLKLLLFVAVDGWRLLLESVLRGYA
jgi:type III secretion protein R